VLFRWSGSVMKSDLGIWQIAGDVIARHGAAADREVVRLANLMLNHGDLVGQVEWLRIWAAIVLLSAEPTRAASPTEIRA